MTTVIETLIVELGLDGRKFTKARREQLDSLVSFMKEATRAGRLDLDRQKQTDKEEDRLAKDRDRRSKRTAEGYKAIRNEVTRLGAEIIAAVGIANMVKQTIQLDASTGRLAGRLGLATQELSMWEGAAQMVGGSAQDADQSIANLTNTLQQYLTTGASPLIGVMQTLHMTMADLAQGPTHALMRMNQAVQGMNKSTATFLLQQMGLSPAMITLVEGPTKALESYLSKANALGNVTEQDAQMAEKAQQAMAEFGRVMTRITNDLLIRFLPALSDTVESFSEMAGSSDGIKNLAKDVGDLAAAVTQLVESTKPGGGANEFGKWLSGVLGWMGGAIGSHLEALAHLIRATQAAFSGDWKLAGSELHAADWAETDSWMGGPPKKPNAPTGAPVAAGGAAGGGGGGGTSGGRGGGGLFGRPGGGGNNFSRNQTAFAVEDYLKRMGVDATTAKGIAAGIYAEGGTPTARPLDKNGNPISSAYGIAQWLLPRQREFRRMFGHDIQGSPLSEQLQFLWHELNGGYGPAKGVLSGGGSSSAVAGRFLRQFEAPGPGLGGDYARAGSYLGSGGADYAMVGGGNGGAGGVGGGSFVSIGSIIVNTKATDATGIARDIGGALSKVAQANTGLQ